MKKREGLIYILERVDSTYRKGWRTKDVNMPCGSRLWRNIMKEWVEFSGNISIRIGDGRRLAFGDTNGVGKTC